MIHCVSRHADHPFADDAPQGLSTVCLDHLGGEWYDDRELAGYHACVPIGRACGCGWVRGRPEACMVVVARIPDCTTGPLGSIDENGNPVESVFHWMDIVDPDDRPFTLESATARAQHLSRVTRPDYRLDGGAWEVYRVSDRIAHPGSLTWEALDLIGAWTGDEIRPVEPVPVRERPS